MATARLAILAAALLLTGCSETDRSPHSWCEEDEHDEIVSDSYCMEGIEGYEWEYDDPSFNPAFVPYYVTEHGRTVTVYRTPTPGYKPPPSYRPPAPPPQIKVAPAQQPAYKPPAYKPPPPKTGK